MQIHPLLSTTDDILDTDPGAAVNVTANANAATRTIVFSSQKGGSGKTTLCGQLAVQAERDNMGPVALIDTDPQGSLSDWWNARGEQTPLFVKTSVESLYETLGELRRSRIKLVFIDTQPTVTQNVQEVIRYADMVVIPTRPSPHDLRAVGPTVDMAQHCNKPMVFAINCATQKARLTSDVAVALSQHGTVAPTIVHNRIDFATSMIDGRAVMELNPQGKSAEEIRSLSAYLCDRLRRLEADENYQTYQNVVEDPHHDAPEATAANEPRGRHCDRQKAVFGRRQASVFGQTKSDDFDHAPAQPSHI